MREILFRAKTIENNQWVEGYFVYVPCSRFLCEEWLIQTIKEDGRIGQLHTVYESTVGQFVGLTDKNGKKIFEGDILQYDQTELSVVEWSKELARFVAHTYTEVNTKKFQSYDPVDSYTGYMPIIGNIYDNPELLERWQA